MASFCLPTEHVVQPCDHYREVTQGRRTSLPSRGSKNHYLGKCRPCRIFEKGEVCREGALCNFCHFPHDSESCSNDCADVSETPKSHRPSVRSQKRQSRHGNAVCVEKPQKLLLSSCLPSATGGRTKREQFCTSSEPPQKLSASNVENSDGPVISYCPQAMPADHCAEKMLTSFHSEEGTLVRLDARCLYGNGDFMQPTIARLDSKFVEEVLKRYEPEQYED